MAAASAPAVTQAQAVLRGCGLPLGESRALLCGILGVAREALVAHPETPVDAATRARFAEAVARRIAGVPLAYLTGEQEFYGHVFRVTPDVLIPRPETELLVDTALGVLQNKPSARVLELGTGSGCIAIALALARPDLWVVASDRSPAALQVARENCRQRAAPVQLVAGDWFAPFQGRFDLVISNPPYVAADDRHLVALACEPRAALTDGGDGLGALRAIVAGAGGFLAAGGDLLLEHGYDQGDAVRELLRTATFREVRTLRDLAGLERMVWAKPGLGGR